ncbi:hypothetical protein GWK47_037168 [Chionoecetes opilio]|uniref:Uncharacterized protein n=1 Tax=Chionoecetes opilio TaxID=41210 RepID=A0A8J5D1J1_CHIOP|nr:hypothetical protein GWK47_037168 [Chionoecetes opilio]
MDQPAGNKMILQEGPKAEAGIKPSPMAVGGSRKLSSIPNKQLSQKEKSSGKVKSSKSNGSHVLNSASKGGTSKRGGKTSSPSQDVLNLSSSDNEEHSTHKKRRITVIEDSDDEMNA